MKTLTAFILTIFVYIVNIIAQLLKSIVSFKWLASFQHSKEWLNDLIKINK